MQELKKKSGTHRQKTYKTGGGKAPPPLVLTPAEEEILVAHKDNIEGHTPLSCDPDFVEENGMYRSLEETDLLEETGSPWRLKLRNVCSNKFEISCVFRLDFLFPGRSAGA